MQANSEFNIQSITKTCITTAFHSNTRPVITSDKSFDDKKSKTLWDLTWHHEKHLLQTDVKVFKHFTKPQSETPHSHKHWNHWKFLYSRISIHQHSLISKSHLQYFPPNTILINSRDPDISTLSYFKISFILKPFFSSRRSEAYRICQGYIYSTLFDTPTFV